MKFISYKYRDVKKLDFTRNSNDTENYRANRSCDSDWPWKVLETLTSRFENCVVCYRIVHFVSCLCASSLWHFLGQWNAERSAYSLRKEKIDIIRTPEFNVNYTFTIQIYESLYEIYRIFTSIAWITHLINSHRYHIDLKMHLHDFSIWYKMKIKIDGNLE